MPSLALGNEFFAPTNTTFSCAKHGRVPHPPMKMRFQPALQIFFVVVNFCMFNFEVIDCLTEIFMSSFSSIYVIFPVVQLIFRLPL